MVDDASKENDDVIDGEFDPNADTSYSETDSESWLDSNVGIRGEEWIGHRIGDFEIIRIIGTGGMSNVYEAKQLHSNSVVALKILKLTAATPAALQRFEMESKMLSRLQHQGIAQVYQSGHQIKDNILLPYFAMEYVQDSRSITAYAKEEQLSRKVRLQLFLQVCDAVQHGHACGVIHRDLKPTNILITASGRPKVIDFGIALMVNADTVENEKADGRFVGTLQWASPEQCGDDPQDVDVRTDVYSLGVLLYQLITGELPYILKGIPLSRAPLLIREANPILPSLIDKTIPAEIDRIVVKSLAKERGSRYDSVAALATDIRLFIDSVSD